MVHRVDVHHMLVCSRVTTPRLLVLTCFKKDAIKVSSDYMRTLKGCCRVRATITGSKGHVTDDKHQLVGAAAAIPRDAVYAVGMDVKLTVNVCPGMGLCNGSRGIVADIIYPGEAGYVRPPGVKSQDATVFPIIIVDFADYIGSPLLQCALEATVDDLHSNLSENVSA